MVFDYSALEFINKELPKDAKILMMWDGQGYYCDERCIPDADQARLSLLTRANPQPKALALTMQESGVTHILIDVEGLSFFNYHDIDGRHQRAASYFFDEFVPSCGNRVYGDEAVLVYEITCTE
jgi:hypothetical protein